MSSGNQVATITPQKSQNKRPYFINIVTRNVRNEQEIETFSFLISTS